MREHKLYWLALMALACYGLADAQEIKPKGKPGDKPTAETTVLAAIDDFGAAFNSHDAKRVAAAWAPDARYTDRTTGEKIAGREAIEAAYTAIFARRPRVELSVAVHSVRLITPDVAQVEATVTVDDATKAGEAGSTSGPIATEFHAILKRAQGEWLLDSGVETALPRLATPENHLSSLEWLVGEWVDDTTSGPRVRSSFRWNKHRTFLIRAFHVEDQGQVVREGTQVIGWDPGKQQIRSWVFGSEGGFAEGIWTEVEGGWSVNLSGTLPDGSHAAVTQVFKQAGPDSLTSQLVGSEVDGQLQPRKPAVTMKRLPAAGTQEQGATPQP